MSVNRLCSNMKRPRLEYLVLFTLLSFFLESVFFLSIHMTCMFKILIAFSKNILIP